MKEREKITLMKLHEIAQLDFVTAEIMPALTMSLRRCIRYDYDKGGYKFDVQRFIKDLKEYDLFGLDADGLIDILLTITE